MVENDITGPYLSDVGDVESFERIDGYLFLVLGSDKVTKYVVHYLGEKYWACSCLAYVFKDKACKHVKQAQDYLEGPYE